MRSARQEKAVAGGTAFRGGQWQVQGQPGGRQRGTDRHSPAEAVGQRGKPGGGVGGAPLPPSEWSGGGGGKRGEGAGVGISPPPPIKVFFSPIFQPWPRLCPQIS